MPRDKSYTFVHSALPVVKALPVEWNLIV